MGEPGEALAALEKEIRISPTNGEYHFLLGRAHLQLQQYAKAVEYYTKAHALRPKDSRPCYGLSVAHARLGQAEQAGRMQEKFKNLRAAEDAAVSQRRKTDFNRDWAIQTLTKTLTGAGIAYNRHKILEKAEERWLRAAALDAKSRVCRHELVDLYVRQGRLGEAVEICGQLQRAYPNIANYHLRAGLLCAQLKQWAPAKRALKKALELDPDNKQIKEAYKRLQERQ
jgi:tetratricopeptide (TPR) repeat protein